mgnify:CR=1 FL=1
MTIVILEHTFCTNKKVAIAAEILNLLISMFGTEGLAIDTVCISGFY